MKISNMAVSNVKGNLYRYVMYYLSNAFAVTVFFIFANFVLHPSIDMNSIGGSATLTQGATRGMIACQVIIVMFSILFVAYSTSIFLKSRGKEFGLLSLYGMTRKQIRKYVFIESTIISILSIVTGILTGAIFSKLFFMIMEVFLDISIPFNISFKALGLTSILFFILFEIISILTVFQIRNKEIVEQLKSSKTPKIIPTFSKFKSILGVLLMVIGYGVAWFVPGMLVAVAMIPVIFIVTLGTYFIFTQFSIAVSNRILKNEKLLYKKTNMVAYSQMIFKLQDTAKVLFLAAILGAFTFSATETMYSFFSEIPRLSGIDTPQDMVIVQRGDSLNDNIEKILDNKDLEIKEIHKMKSLILYSKKQDKDFEQYFVISNTDYNELASSLGKELVDIKEGEIIYSYPYELSPMRNNGEQKMVGWEDINLNIGEETGNFKLIKEVRGNLMSLSNVGYFDSLILNDKDFEEALKIVNQQDQVIYTGINLDKWQDSYESSIEIRNELGGNYSRAYYSKAIPYKEARNNFGLALFIGFFIAFLFFIASGSIIYFKLFNEIKQDAVEYAILRKIGTTSKEINKIITKQIGIIFFLPFVVSTLHSFFALKSLSNMLMTNLFTNGVIVMFGYLIFQMIYFIIIRAIYIKRINYN